MFEIENFLSEINSRGIAKPSNYDVMVFGPQIDDTTSVERSLPMRCIATELPGRQLQTVEQFQYGLPYIMPTLTVFPDLTLQILLDEKHNVREYFEKWIDKIVGPYRKGQITPDMFNLGFYEDYVGTIEITNYDEREELRRKTTLIDVYPKSIAETNMTWDMNGEFMTVGVTFVFRRYTNS